MYKNEPGDYKVYSFVRSAVVDDSYVYTKTSIVLVSGLYVPITCNKL